MLGLCGFSFHPVVVIKVGPHRFLVGIVTILNRGASYFPTPVSLFHDGTQVGSGKRSINLRSLNFGKEIVLLSFCDVSVADHLTARAQIVEGARIDSECGNSSIRSLSNTWLCKILRSVLTLVGRDRLGGIVEVCLNFILNLFELLELF